MPKIVDPQVRRRQVADAVFRVVARDGVAEASLRNVADEAGLAIGSVRHYCGTHQELMAMVLQALQHSFESRFERHLEELQSIRPGSADYRRLLERVLAEFLPLDQARRRETAVWLEFEIASRTDSSYQPYVGEIGRGMRMIVGRILQGLRGRDALVDGIDIDVEADRLVAVLDGLAIRGISAEAMPPERAIRVLNRHLDTIVDLG